MSVHFRLHLDIEKVSKQLGIDLQKFRNVYEYEERQKQGNLQARERSEGKADPGERLYYRSISDEKNRLPDQDKRTLNALTSQREQKQ